MKLRILFTIGLLLLFCFGFKGCGEKPNSNDPLSNFKPNKAELGEDWKQFRHDAAQITWVFDEKEFPVRPQEHRTAKGARVFWNGTVTAEELSLIDDGLTEMLSMCRRDQKDWIDSRTGQWKGNIWTKFPYFQNVSDYKVILVKPNYTSQEGETRGCAGMITGPQGDCGSGPGTCATAGTVAGLIDRFNSIMPASQGGIYLLIPKQSAEQLSRPACKTLMRNGVRHEGEHIFFTNDSGLYFAYANDGLNGNHPYCKGM